MRRHSLDPDHIKRQIKSVFTSPTRKLRHFTSHHPTNHTDHSIIKFTRRTRRFSVPEKPSSTKVDHNCELQTIDEVS